MERQRRVSNRSLFPFPYLYCNIIGRFSFCECPYLLSTTAKSELLRIECLLHMRHELQDAFFRTLFIGVNSPYLQRKALIFTFLKITSYSNFSAL